MPKQMIVTQQVSPAMSTAGIGDKRIRAVLDSVIAALDERSGFTNPNSPDRFITAGEFLGMTTEAMGAIFGRSGPGGAPGSGLASSAEINRAIDALADSIRQSLVYQLLEQPVPLINIDELRQRIAAAAERLEKRADEVLATATERIEAAFGEAQTLILEETTNRQTADANIVTSVNAIGTRMGAAEAAILSEAETRASADQATTTQLNAAISRLGTAEGAIVSEAQTRAAADEATTSQLAAAVSRIGTAEAAITSEATTRASADQAQTNALNSAVSRIADAEAAIISEASTRATADTAQTNALNAAVSRIDTAEAGLSTEATTRAQRDTALARAVNNIWSAMGGNTAVIEDGGLAQSGASVAQATKWNQVQAAAIDPNTGQATSAVVRQELQSYANSANNSFNAIYSVRAQIAVDGRTVVGGFGLAATAGAGSAGGPTIDFGVRADRFFIAATSATPDAATQIAQGSSIPFMVLTSPQIVNGVWYPPGVYIKKALIGAATIGDAEIANASVGMAKIVYTLSSANYIGGVQGWAINQGGYAEFNDVIIRRNTLIASGYDGRSIMVLGYVRELQNDGKGGFYYYDRPLPVGTVIRGDTFYINTGYSDYDAVANAYAPGFYGRIDSPNLSSIWPGNLSGNVYELAFEIVAAPQRTWGVIGSNTPGQRVQLAVTPLVTMLQQFTQIQINGLSWALFRQR